MFTFDLIKQLLPKLFQGFLASFLASLMLGPAAFPNDHASSLTSGKVPEKAPSVFAQEQGLSFTATLVTPNGQVLSGHKVSLFDITEARFFVSEKVTNAQGQAQFKALPLSRNYSVYIDGEAVGYTFRNSESAQMRRSFILNAPAAQDAPTVYASQPAIVKVFDEESNPLGEVEVELLFKDQSVAKGRTDFTGEVRFDQIQEGVFYDLKINGEPVKNFARSGESVSVFVAGLSSDIVENEIPTSPITKETLSFTAFVADQNKNVLEGQTVRIIDTTQKRLVVAEKKTDAKGQAHFDKLPADRSYTVEINGEETGYTFRSSDESQMKHSFLIDPQSTSDEQLKTVNATVSVSDENGFALSQQKVSLSRNGKVVAEALTDGQGQATLSGLLEGTLYDVEVNGQKIPFAIVQGGASTSVSIAK